MSNFKVFNDSNNEIVIVDVVSEYKVFDLRQEVPLMALRLPAVNGKRQIT